MYIFKAGTEKQYAQADIFERLNGALFDEYIRYSYSGELEVSFHPHNDDLDLIEDAKPETVALVHLRFFDDTATINNKLSIVDVADMYDEEVYLGAHALEQSGMMDLEVDANKAYRDFTDVYIKHLYVMPKYRNKGIAKFVLSNLRDILKAQLNIELRCAFVAIEPQEFTENGNSVEWDKADDPNDEMRKLMIKTITDNGFELLGDSEYYGRNYAVKEEKFEYD